jgi:hypothetical protein
MLAKGNLEDEAEACTDLDEVSAPGKSSDRGATGQDGFSERNKTFHRNFDE